MVSTPPCRAAIVRGVRQRSNGCEGKAGAFQGRRETRRVFVDREADIRAAAREFAGKR